MKDLPKGEAQRASDSPQFWAALNTISSGRIAPVAGGVLIRQAGQVLGSIGMSGDLPDNDEACAQCHRSGEC
jgi:uncharacterized protein GlcG (DUF336 family)